MEMQKTRSTGEDDSLTCNAVCFFKVEGSSLGPRSNLLDVNRDLGQDSIEVRMFDSQPKASSA